jgi:hypothetical protein
MKFGAEIIDLTKVDFTPELLRCIPAEVVRKYRVLPVFDSPGRLAVALGEADEMNVIDSLTYILMRPELEIKVAAKQQIEIFIQRLYGDFESSHFAVRQVNYGLNSWCIVQSLVLGFLFSLFFAIFCTPTKAQDTFSPQLNQFLASHPQALLVLSNEFAETKGPARIRIDIFYFYTDDETVPTAHHSFVDGSPSIAIFVRGGG